MKDMWNLPSATRTLVIGCLAYWAGGEIVALAQNLGAQPQLGAAVLGQTGAQPEGTIMNIVNWIGNVVAPVSAAGAVFGAVVSFVNGRGVFRWILTAAGLLMVSGLTRLVEFFITNGTGGVS